MKKKSIVTVRMIVVIATAVVSVFLHTETNAGKTAISRRLGKKFFGSCLADRAGWIIRNTGIFFLGLIKLSELESQKTC